MGDIQAVSGANGPPVDPDSYAHSRKSGLILVVFCHKRAEVSGLVPIDRAGCGHRQGGMRP